MSERNEYPVGNGAAAALLLGTALGGAALLLSTPQGRRLAEQAGERLAHWTEQTAAAIAETREKIVSAVEAQLSESQTPGDPPGRVRENR